jgi:Tfp pilus assembly protein PilP
MSATVMQSAFSNKAFGFCDAFAVGRRARPIRGLDGMALGQLLVCLLLGFGMACSEDKEEYRDFNSKTVRPGMSSIDARKRLKSKETGVVEKAQKPDEGDGKMKLSQITETSFINSLKMRDPFETFAEVFESQSRVSGDIQRTVKLGEYDISVLRLIGIITNIGNPMAMVTVPDGTGFVIKGGDFVGRADLIKHAGGDTVPVNWRVARIHGSGKEEERGVYLSRDTGGAELEEGYEVTRFLPLHPSVL